MRTITLHSAIIILSITYSQPVFAQASGGNQSWLLSGLVIVSVVLVLWALLTLANNLMKIEANKHGIDTRRYGFSVFPGLSDFIHGYPKYIHNAKFIKLGKGHDILMVGEAKKEVKQVTVNRFAIKPTDFHGMSPIPKVIPAIGDTVKAGDPLFFDKKREGIHYCSPVSGEIVSVERGDKRAITSVVILADKQMQYRTFNVPDIEKTDRSALVSFLQESGLWVFINERPFDRVPETDKIPVNIFISTFDTAPAAPDLNFIVDGQESAFQKGLDVLNKLTSGKVHLGLDGRDRNKAPHDAFLHAKDVEKTFFAGKHPAGNVGIQIHHTAPIKPGQTVWTLGVQDVITIGNMFLHGKFDASRVVAMTGAELKEPMYAKTYLGCNIGDVLKENLQDLHARIVSGDVLSGNQVSLDGFLGFKDDQITVLKEGDEYELFGWLLPLRPRPSISGTFPNFLYPDHKFELDTNTHGEKRAMVVTGQYEEVLPVDTYPQHLFKAILANDLEKMEGLGILELTEEDVALCEFVCTSKTPIQSILRQGLEIIKEQS